MTNVETQPSEDYFDAGKDVYELLDLIASKFARFRGINTSHILVSFKSGKCSFTAKTCKLPAYMASYLPGKKLILLLNATEYDLMGKPRRVALLWHELLHIVNGDKGYKIAKHDLNDFKELITRVGISYENADELLKDLEK